MLRNSKEIILLINLIALCCLVFPGASANENDTSRDVTASGVEKLQITNEDEDKVVISIVNYGRSNPFKPYEPPKKRKDGISLDEIPYPPARIGEKSEGYELLKSSRVNGILYDPYAKSVAIINVEGADYMLHKGDMVKGILIENIEKTSVTLRYGQNTFTMAVGDVVDGDVNYDSVDRQEKIFAETGCKLPDLELEGAVR